MEGAALVVQGQARGLANTALTRAQLPVGSWDEFVLFCVFFFGGGGGGGGQHCGTTAATHIPHWQYCVHYAVCVSLQACLCGLPAATGCCSRAGMLPEVLCCLRDQVLVQLHHYLAHCKSICVQTVVDSATPWSRPGQDTTTVCLHAPGRVLGEESRDFGRSARTAAPSINSTIDADRQTWLATDGDVKVDERVGGIKPLGLLGLLW